MGTKGKVEFASLKGFKSLENDNRIVTMDFLDSSREIVTVFGKFYNECIINLNFTHSYIIKHMLTFISLFQNLLDYYSNQLLVIWVEI